MTLQNRFHLATLETPIFSLNNIDKAIDFYQMALEMDQYIL